jgi:hypothetical protein
MFGGFRIYSCSGGHLGSRLWSDSVRRRHVSVDGIVAFLASGQCEGEDH